MIVLSSHNDEGAIMDVLHFQCGPAEAAVIGAGLEILIADASDEIAALVKADDQMGTSDECVAMIMELLSTKMAAIQMSDSIAAALGIPPRTREV